MNECHPGNLGWHFYLSSLSLERIKSSVSKHKKTITTYGEANMESVFQKLIVGWPELADFYAREISPEPTSADRLPYVDMAEIVRFLVNKLKAEATDYFPTFFGNVEAILLHADESVRNLIIVGLFEDIQNIAGQEIDYHRAFNPWLGNSSLREWRALIDSWEGTDWKKSPEAERILNTRQKL